MSRTMPTQEQGHLLAAAVRVLRHRSGRPPQPQEIAKLLDWGEEQTRVVMRGLVDAGILRMHETPFEVRLEILDHRKLEELPEQEGDELQAEVDAFRRTDRSRKEKLEQMFDSGELDERRRRETEALEKQFTEFQKKKPRPPC